MKKVFLFTVAVLCAVNMFAVPAPTNVHWEEGVLKWELPALTDDSVYTDVWLCLYNEAGAMVTNSATGSRIEYNFTDDIFHGRTYYATIKTGVKPGGVQSALITSPTYTDPNPKDTIEVPDVALNVNGVVSWGYISYMYVRITLQKQSGESWENVNTKKTSNGWDKSISFGAITSPGTYRAVAEGLQGEDVVRRGISPELVVEEMFTVSFNAQSLFTNPDDIIVAKNALISKPTPPNEFHNQNNGHVFYWSSDAAGTRPWAFAKDRITQDTTLYAQWIELPALNPVWDVDTCTWTLVNRIEEIIHHRVIYILTEDGNEVLNSSGSIVATSWFGDYCLYPGRTYKFAIKLVDFYENYVSDTSALHTISGEVETLPLVNMTVANTTNGRIEWSAPNYGTYIRHGELSRWNEITSAWETLQMMMDMSPTWDNTFLVFGQALNAEEYYKIHCTLNQGEYVIYEGVMFHGHNPSTAFDNIDVNTKAVKRIVDGQFIIQRGPELYNAQGARVK